MIPFKTLAFTNDNLETLKRFDIRRLSLDSMSFTLLRLAGLCTTPPFYIMDHDRLESSNHYPWLARSSTQPLHGTSAIMLLFILLAVLSGLTLACPPINNYTSTPGQGFFGPW